MGHAMASHALRKQRRIRRRGHGPLRSVNIGCVYADGGTVIVLWEGSRTTTDSTTYESTDAWFRQSSRRQGRRPHRLLRQHELQQAMGRSHACLTPNVGLIEVGRNVSGLLGPPTPRSGGRRPRSPIPVEKVTAQRGLERRRVTCPSLPFAPRSPAWRAGPTRARSGSVP